MSTFLEDKIRAYGASCVAIQPGWSSGFFVSPDTIMTAGHVLRGRPSELEIHLRNRNVIRGVIRLIDHVNDIGLVKVNPAHHNQPALEISDRLCGYLLPREVTMIRLSPTLGENGYMIEYEGGTSAHGWERITTKDNGTIVNPLTISAMHAPPGCSGSPIMRGGRVIGMIVAGSATDNRKYAVNHMMLREALRD